MKIRAHDIACLIIGRVNRRLYLEETEGWMECEYCKAFPQYFPSANKPANRKNVMTNCISRFDRKKPCNNAIFRGNTEIVLQTAASV